MTRSLVAAPFIPIASFMASHRGSQGVIYADMIAQTGEDVTINFGGQVVSDFNEFDKLYVYHGNDWTGRLNLYGGLEGFPYSWNFRNMTHFRGEVISLAIPFPDYHGLLKHNIDLTIERGKGGLIQEEWNEVDWDNLLKMQSSSVITHPNRTSRIVVGDSHTTCMYRPGWTINSIPFKTLHGVLKEGIINRVLEVYDNDPNGPEEIELYFGNIDCRHHLCRQEDPIAATDELVEKYVNQAHELFSLPRVRSVKIYELLPIEDESRVIPKTGWYDNKPFHGSREERDRIRLRFREVLEHIAPAKGVQPIRWVSYLENERGELDTSFMEYKKSVHLSRACYPHWTGVEYQHKFLHPKKNGIPKNFSRPSASLEEFLS